MEGLLRNSKLNFGMDNPCNVFSFDNLFKLIFKKSFLIDLTADHCRSISNPQSSFEALKFVQNQTVATLKDMFIMGSVSCGRSL